MGWKLAIAIIPLKNRSVEDAVAGFYGAPKSLQDSDLAVDQILYPENGRINYVSFSRDHVWLFDWRFVMDALQNGYKGNEDATFLLLQSTTNLYGFAKYENGAELRRRAGSADDGFYADNGELLEVERKAVTGLCGDINVDTALKAWSDPEEIAESYNDELTHDVMGEDVVFSLMETVTGFRFDKVSDECDAFFKKTVFLTTGRKKLFGLI
ncbi:MAG: hypothetical protein AAFW68_08165 [Pseudomonadota bacterium]